MGPRSRRERASSALVLRLKGLSDNVSLKIALAKQAPLGQADTALSTGQSYLGSRVPSPPGRKGWWH